MKVRSDLGKLDGGALGIYEKVLRENSGKLQVELADHIKRERWRRDTRSLEPAPDVVLSLEEARSAELLLLENDLRCFAQVAKEHGLFYDVCFFQLVCVELHAEVCRRDPGEPPATDEKPN